MNFKNPKISNVPTKGSPTALKVALFGGAAVYAAFVFHRINGIKNKGQAKSIELIDKAMSSGPPFLTLRQIEAAGEISHTKVFLDSKDLLLNI